MIIHVKGRDLRKTCRAPPPSCEKGLVAGAALTRWPPSELGVPFYDCPRVMGSMFGWLQALALQSLFPSRERHLCVLPVPRSTNYKMQSPSSSFSPLFHLPLPGFPPDPMGWSVHEPQPAYLSSCQSVDRNMDGLRRKRRCRSGGGLEQ